MHKNRRGYLHYGDLTDSESLIRLIREIKPTEIYNLGAQSHVQVSFEVPEYTADCDATGVLRILEAVHFLGMEKTCRIYQASTSELFGLVQEIPQKETTPFYPTAEVETLLGDPTKAKSVLGWNPTKTSFPELVKIMMRHDMEYVKAEKTLHQR